MSPTFVVSILIAVIAATVTPNTANSAPASASAKTIKGIDGVEIQLEQSKNAKRILVLNASNVEILYRLGLQSRIVGTDVGTKFPPETEKIPKVGHPYRPSIEGMISLQPELVIASEENLPEATVQQLRSAKIPVLIIENSGKRIEDLEKRIQTIATATGVPDEGSKLTTEMKKKFEETKNKADALRKKHGLKRVFFLYAHGPGKAFIYGTETGSHVLIELVGAKNAADFTSGVKPLTAEAMVQAAPDAIIMLERGLTSVEGLEGALKLPGVALTPAGKNRLIIQVDDSIRWISPRFPDFASKLLAELYKEKP